MNEITAEIAKLEAETKTHQSDQSNHSRMHNKAEALDKEVR